MTSNLKIYVRQLSIIGYTAINLESGRVIWRKLELFKKHFFSNWQLGIILNAACRHLPLLCEKFDNRVFSSVTVLTSSLQSCSYVAAKNAVFQTNTSVKDFMICAVTWKIWFKKGRGRVGPSKNWVGQYFLLERGDKPVKGVDVEMEGGGCYFFYHFTVPFSHVYFVWAGKVWYPFITFRIFSLLS